MKIHSYPSSRRLVAFFSLVAAFAALTARADDNSRAGRWELAGVGEFLSSSSASAQAGRLRVSGKFTSITAAGVSASYFLTDSIGLNAQIVGGRGTLEASALGFSASDDITVVDSAVGVAWMPMRGAFTPVIGAHVGMFSFSGGSTGTGSESDFAYGGSAGFRYEISRNWGVQATYRLSLTKFTDFEDRTRIGGANITVGYKF